MATTHDGLAIVAANLTAAHCTLFGPMPNPESGDLAKAIRETVERIYADYLSRLDEGHIPIPPQP